MYTVIFLELLDVSLLLEIFCPVCSKLHPVSAWERCCFRHFFLPLSLVTDSSVGQRDNFEARSQAIFS